MFSAISTLIDFIDLNPDLKLLFSKIQESDDDFWLVGGCLRNSVLGLPQADIDIACSSDPTALTQLWSAEIAGHWFWLDSKRKQSRVLLKNGLSLDFTPLRAPSITEDLQLRDFTINALALPLDVSFPDSELIDPSGGVDHLRQRQLHTCSTRSFPDDPLRMLKGIRHAVTLDFTISNDTLDQIVSSANLLDNVAGERIRDELGKILDSKNIINGIEMLLETGLLEVIFGSAGSGWDRDTAIDEIRSLNARIQKIKLLTDVELTASGEVELFSTRTLFLLARLLKNYSPQNFSVLLHRKLRLSRGSQRLLKELQTEPDLKLFSLATSIEGQRQQALLVEQMEPFAYEKMLYWGVCGDLITLEKVLELQQAFNAEQKLGRIPDLLNGRLIAALLNGLPQSRIGRLQTKAKQAEINGEIRTVSEAENWLKRHLDP